MCVNDYLFVFPCCRINVFLRQWQCLSSNRCARQQCSNDIWCLHNTLVNSCDTYCYYVAAVTD